MVNQRAKPRRPQARRLPRGAPAPQQRPSPLAGLSDLEASLESDSLEPDNMGPMMEMDAFDQLPPTVREALRATPYGCPAEELFERLLAGHSEQQLLTFLETYTSRSRREAIARGTPAELTAWPALPMGRKAGAYGRR